jgi:hypothetical protein
MVPDDFAGDELDFEVWLRVKMPPTIVSPRLATYLRSAVDHWPFYTAEYGNAAKPLVPASLVVGGDFGIVRAGTLTVPVNAGHPTIWELHHDFAWDMASSTGELIVDYVLLNLSRARALSPTGISTSDGYPSFAITATSKVKRIRSDLTATAAANISDTSRGRGPGLGGSPLELPPGNVDVVVLTSGSVPDNPDSVGSDKFIDYQSVTFTVTPRYWLARGD